MEHGQHGRNPVGSTTLIRVMEQIGFFSALGVVVVLVAAAPGRIASVASGIVPVGAHARTAPVTETVPVQTRRTEETVDDTADTERTEVIR